MAVIPVGPPIQPVIRIRSKPQEKEDRTWMLVLAAMLVLALLGGC